MDDVLRRFADDADSASVNRLLALSEVIKTVPKEKMAKIKKLDVQWVELEDELVPSLTAEFFE